VVSRAALAGVAALAALGCQPPDRGPRYQPAGATQPHEGGRFRFAVQIQLRTLDPAIAFDDVAFYAMHPMFDTLVDYAPGSTALIPRLAEHWAISPDARVYAFDLRPGITFSDGTPITAAHFRYSLERTMKTADSPFTSFVSDIAGADEFAAGKTAFCSGIATQGDRRLVITLANPNAGFLNILAMPFTTPQRPDHVAAAGDQLRRLPDATGPFMLESWDEGNRVVLRRNPHYYDPARAHLDQIIMLENIARDTQFQMFERGELDSAALLAAPDYLFVMSEPAWQPYVHRVVGMNAFGSRMNVRVKPFDDRRVRQALNYALDKDHISRLLNGTTVPSHGILAPGMLGRDPEIAPYPHDVAKARALLAEAGYPHGFETEYVTLADEETEKVAGSLQSDLAAVGVRVHITVMAWATYGEAIAQARGPAFSYASWVADYPDSSDFFDVRFHSRSIKDVGSPNDSFYANPALDALLDDARRSSDPDHRAVLYRQAERILYDDAPWIWSYHLENTEVVQPYVRDYAPHPIWARDYTSAWFDVGPDGAPIERAAGAAGANR
jgi:ABC-type transport system substrate-binding protein